MKLTASQLRKIIAEEVSKSLNEAYDPKQQIVNILGRISQDLGRLIAVSGDKEATKREVADLQREIGQAQELVQQLK